MAKRVTNEDIIKINEVYAAVKTYAETARQTGFSASTVKKYINPNFTLLDKPPIMKLDFVRAVFPPYPANGTIWRNLMELTNHEKEKILELQKEVVI